MPEWSPSARTRRRVTERADGRCEYCLCPLDFVPDPFAVEHIIPQARGGTHHLANLALSCQG
jgi:5-methylcytosine-specific restriction endonuclease McrA